MGPKVNHHVLPRYYLKGFAESQAKPFTWVYTKGRSYLPGSHKEKHSPARLPIRSAAVVPLAYGYLRRDGFIDPDTYENILEKLEKPSDPILKKIRARIAVDDNEKRVLASYILLMHRRGPRRNERVQETWAEVLETSPTIHLIRSPGFLATLPEDKRAQVEELVADYDKPPKELLLKTMVIDLEQAAIALSGMHWRFRVASGDSRFVTGDVPVFVSSLGLTKLASELSIPLSTDITLEATWQPSPEGYTPASQEYVEKLNNRVASMSQQLFYYRSEEWVTKILNKPHRQA